MDQKQEVSIIIEKGTLLTVALGDSSFVFEIDFCAEQEAVKVFSSSLDDQGRACGIFHASDSVLAAALKPAKPAHLEPAVSASQTFGVVSGITAPHIAPALEEAPKRPEILPMDSAPRDGKVIMLVEQDPPNRVWRGAYYNNFGQKGWKLEHLNFPGLLSDFTFKGWYYEGGAV